MGELEKSYTDLTGGLTDLNSVALNAKTTPPVDPRQQGTPPPSPASQPRGATGRGARAVARGAVPDLWQRDDDHAARPGLPAAARLSMRTTRCSASRVAGRVRAMRELEVAAPASAGPGLADRDVP